MPTQVFATGQTTGQSRSAVHILTLMVVWLMAASSGLVFSEPCLTDAISMGLIVLLPLIGLTRVTQPLAMMFMLWMSLGILALIACIGTADSGIAVKHTLVSFYLYGMTFTVAGFIAYNPLSHTRIIMHGWTIAALIAAAAGIVGYFGLVPGSEIFTKFGRAAGTFKDPNVFGPFLVPAFLLAMHNVLTRPVMRVARPLAIVLFLAIAIFLSFSRGAWLNLILSMAIYLLLLFVFCQDNGLRRKLIVMSLVGTAFAAISVAALMQVEQVSDLAEQRMTNQSYDVGPEGRFGGQIKAIDLALAHPLGLGAQQFGTFHHHEEPHNVYINMFLNTGWAGGVLYMIMVALTIGIGFATIAKSGRSRTFLMIALAAFIGNAAEGVIIDTDHWRHFYVLMAIIWGIASAPPLTRQRKPTIRTMISKQAPLSLTPRAAIAIS